MVSCLLVGDEVSVVTAVNLRHEPMGAVLKVLQPEDRLTITGGPRQRDGLTWWQVRNGVSGWVAEMAKNRTVLIDRADDSAFGFPMRFVLREEAGENTDPNDKGGYTLWGISQKAFPRLDIRSLTLERTKGIYYAAYWQPCQCDNLPWPLRLAAFDVAVNAGVGTAFCLLARTQDFLAFNDERRAFHRKSDQFDLYGEQWLARTDRVEATGLAWNF